MKDIIHREEALLAEICKKHNTSLKLANELIRAAKKFSYENESQGRRINEYLELIDIYSKNK